MLPIAFGSLLCFIFEAIWWSILPASFSHFPRTSDQIRGAGFLRFQTNLDLFYYFAELCICQHPYKTILTRSILLSHQKTN